MVAVSLKRFPLLSSVCSQPETRMEGHTIPVGVDVTGGADQRQSRLESKQGGFLLFRRFRVRHGQRLVLGQASANVEERAGNVVVWHTPAEGRVSASEAEIADIGSKRVFGTFRLPLNSYFSPEIFAFRTRQASFVLTFAV